MSHVGSREQMEKTKLCSLSRGQVSGRIKEMGSEEEEADFTRSLSPPGLKKDVRG